MNSLTKQGKLLFLGLFLLIAVGVAITKTTVSDQVSLSVAEQECKNIDLWMLYDNPIERVGVGWLGKTAVLEKIKPTKEAGFIDESEEKNVLLIKAYTLFRIPVGKSSIQCGGSSYKIPRTQEGVKTQATEALKAVADAANELSGITSGAVFNFAIDNLDGRSANFGIVQYVNEVKGERIVEEHIVTFREVGTPTSNTAEVDRETNKVIAMHRSVPDFANSGDPLPIQELENRARQFAARVGAFDSVLVKEGTEFTTNSKGDNYFLRWNDKRFAVPSGLNMDIPPFIQVGINSRGFIFSYDNTYQLYHNLSKEDLRTLCGFVEMPQTDDSTLIREKGVVTVWFTEYEPFQNRYLILPYEPETDFEGCSESAKIYLRHLPNDPDKN